ncbi:ORF6N domain-containing protein [Citrobacter freundii]|nr:ORF6N domain-containing protein [Citrobacter freundii]EJH9802946.1 ORF6N domain-containing protein [Salmonella enterica]EKA7904288.1 ORF6N domain-containing protein [Citrobacter freundii]EKV5431228.1 ORF6N domain-containing protein [Citrobacter freundii]EKY1513807.1 ORF6N domain-containing protein [Citrobacter freundii]
MENFMQTSIDNVAKAKIDVHSIQLSVIEWSGVRVVTTETLATGYGCEEKSIRMNLSRNLDRFVEGKHYYMVTGKDLKALRATVSGSQISSKARSIMLWTEQGAARMSKIVDTDEAWSFFERLEDSYFRPAPVVGIPLSYEEALEDLLAKVKENRVITEQRDRAVKEKLWISEKREVTAMTTASIAVREKNKLAERLGEGKNYAAIIPVEKKLGQKFKWQPLRKWCRDNDASPHDVDDPRFGSVKSWPRAAWLAVYGVDLRKIF